ncbi:MAG TPA: D-glycerate dehydrogenase [Candidatus Avamphibacillus sp.]|nr:D-glycerate dehydrogenase [Candidatus Avamphibacillus sp.]
MFMKKIIVYNRLEKPVLERLEKTYDVHFFKDVDPKTDPDFLHHLKDADGIMGLELQVDKELLDHAPQLKVVSNVSVGYNNLDIEELTKRGILATNTPGVLDDTVADTIFGILMATARRIPELDQLVKSGNWKTVVAGSEYYGTDVHHKTLGIIGMGRIGQAIAKRAHFGFDMKILYHNRSRKPEAEKEYNATYLELDELLKKADFVCLMTPLTPETEGMIGKREFELMKRSAIFINGSRGKTIVEKELIEALQEGEIAAAGLDVFEQEPVQPDNPLLNMKNVVTTPHVGSSTHETELKMSELAAKNMEAGLNGVKPPNLIDQGVWQK